MPRTDATRLAPPLALHPLDIAAGMIVGADGGTPPLVAEGPTPSPRQALVTLVQRALARPPCMVSFSGGRDSSAMLALALDVARRQGLPEPIPITSRFPGIEATDEAEWQESVISHLGAKDWVRITIHDELDAVGPVATAVLRRHGVLYPYNNHFHVPLFEAARGGSLITGSGGDELTTPMLWGRVARVIHRVDPPRPVDLLRLAVVAAPRALRQRAIAYRQPVPVLPWLWPDVDRLVRRRMNAWYADQPVRFDRALCEWWWTSRYLQFGRVGLNLLAADNDVELSVPLGDPTTVRAVAVACGPLGYPSRQSAMEQLFGDLIPPATTARPTKATFGEVVFGRHSREFAAQWSGGGVDSDLVDSEGLAQAWAAPSNVDCRTILLLQSAWLAEDRRSVASTEGGRGQRHDQVLHGRGERAPAPGTGELQGRERQEVEDESGVRRQAHALLSEEQREELLR
jgi:asparagine synthase (glutamine-hydrolysing)